MSGTNLSFAKIVATPTASTWSQAYNAGSLFIVLSLLTEDEALQEELPAFGKEILNNIEAEFFALEEKSFETIKQALSQSTHQLNEKVLLSLSLAYIKEDTLYGFILGGGRITLKRGEKIGTILHEDPKDDRTISSASGYLSSDDLVLLQTTQFLQSVPSKTITEAFEFTLPSDIAETISPHIHGESNGGASAIIISFKGVVKPALDEQILPETQEPPDEKMETESFTPEATSHQEKTFQHEAPLGPEEQENKKGSTFKLPTITFPKIQLSARRKMTLGIAVLLIGVLIVASVLVLSTKESQKTKALFNEIYTSAKKDYDEAEGLLSLNKSLAHDDYEKAKETLAKADGKFKPGSDEAIKIDELSQKINERLQETEGVSKISTAEVPDDDAPLLALKKSSGVIAVAEDEDNWYTLTKTVVAKIPKSTSKKETIITNDEDWTKPVGLGVFGGNIYVLDTSKGFLKFVPTSDSYALSTYFKEDKPNLSSAVSLGIDSSVYILFSNGTIEKYAKGIKTDFEISGLKDQFSKPTYLFASPDVSNIYILDTATSRIVKLSSDGAFQTEYQAPILKNATILTVSNDEKSAFVLSGDKVYQLTF
ncbi:MAG: hypothetical protein HZC02_05130 [Candidatus Levybacteria bacterium]|nr:hypothetical protein [Candidatus Levybacteria bacterium]